VHVAEVVILIALLLVLGVGYIAMAPNARENTRERLREGVAAFIRQARHEATRSRPESDQFREALRARTRWAVVTPALVVVNVAVFVLMLWVPGAISDPETLAGWGGNFWLLTRNGEWWRLVTSMFVHTGLLHLLVNVGCLAQIGLILERLVGRLIVIAVFMTAGVFASLVNLTTHPMAMSVGASGAVFGLYGLLLASSIWGMRHRSSVTIPLIAVKMLAPAAAVFILYNLVNDNLGSGAELTGLLVGLVSGTVLAKGVSDLKPAARRVAHLTGAAVVIAVLSAIPLRGISDVKPEIERTVAAEDRMAAAYRKAAERFGKGQITSDALALLIDRTITPELQVTSARLKALVGVPEEHQPLVANAEEYVRLRSEGWRLRSEWLRKNETAPRRGGEAALARANNRTIARATDKERAALQVLERIRPAESGEDPVSPDAAGPKAAGSTP
jgi:membrane associated rhomboid family serine protease